jgi:hypothetical protein
MPMKPPSLLGMYSTSKSCVGSSSGLDDDVWDIWERLPYSVGWFDDLDALVVLAYGIVLIYDADVRASAYPRRRGVGPAPGYIEPAL